MSLGMINGIAFLNLSRADNHWQEIKSRKRGVLYTGQGISCHFISGALRLQSIIFNLTKLLFSFTVLKRQRKGNQSS